MTSSALHPALGLSAVDWWVIIIYLVVSVLIGVLLSKRATKDSESYFKSSGGVTWWLLGTSMVATTFAADTPLVLAGWVVTSGIAKNWFWWSQVPIVMIGVFFFARLWKRANPLTDMEFVYVRYSGKSAGFLRGFKAIYLAIPYGCLILGWVNKAMTKVISLTIPDFPRIPVIDSVMLSVFLATPLSSSVDTRVKQAVRDDQIQPIDIAYNYNLMNYDHAMVFSDIEYGVYKAKPEEALNKLGLADRLATYSLSGIEGVDPALYKSGAESGGAESVAGTANASGGAGALASSAASSDLIRPVTLADGMIISYEKLQRLEEKAYKVGKEQIIRAVEGKKDKKAPLAGMGTVDFLQSIYTVASGVNQYKILFLLFLLTVSYTFISGLWGVLVTDFFQFWLAMFGCILAAILAVKACGGMDGMMTRMAGIYGLAKARAMVSLVPTGESGGLGLISMGEFLLFITLVWWTVGFTDGGSIFAQRMLSAKDERHAALGYLWFGIAHFALRMWPWILVGFAAAILFPFTPFANGQVPSGSVAEDGYVKVLLAVMPRGLLGLMIAAFFAAYMSTISTWINIGASYLMNDFYRPFIAPHLQKRDPALQFNEKHYLRIGMAMTLVIAACGIVISLYLNTIADAWFLLSSFNAGIGVIYLLRWYWHRVNAWTEVSCIAALLFAAAALKWTEDQYNIGVPFPYSLLIAFPFSLIVSLLVTLLTQPTDRQKLVEFCRKVQPGGPGWRDIEAEIRKDDPSWKPHSPLTLANVRNCILASVCVYCFLFGIGKLAIGDVLFPEVTGTNVFLGIVSLAVLATAGIQKLLEFKSWFTVLGVGVGIYILLAIFRNLIGATPAQTAVNGLFTNVSIGILLIVVGTVLAVVVGSSFMPKKWTETPTQ